MAEAMAEGDFLCPICMQIIRDAFLTACGHSFCYMCIVTHLQNKSDCPCCAQFLTPAQIFPNFLLDKFLKKASAHQQSKIASPVEQFRQLFEQGYDVSIKELDSLLSLLLDKKRKLEQQETKRNMQIMLEFLQCLRKQKVSEIDEVQNDLQRIKEDLISVEKHRVDLYQARDRYSMKLKMVSDDHVRKRSWTSSLDKDISSQMCNSYDVQGSLAPLSNLLNEREADVEVKHIGMQSVDNFSSGPNSKSMSQSGFAVMRKKRIHAQFNELQEFYLQRRHQPIDHLDNPGRIDDSATNREGYSTSLADFQSVLSTFTRFSRLRVIAELRHEDIFHSTNIVSSIEFDRDDELFATAGVSRHIKVFDYSSVINESDLHRPVVDMATRSKLSCLSWNKFSKSTIASSDYEGIVTVWDVDKQQSVMEYEEHEKRAWSVDFSRSEPSMLVSGSDDCKVKVWCTKQEASVLSIDMKANICCVKYNPGSSKFIAVGSADHHIHYYDLRNASHPLHVFSSHTKAVSYVKFLSSNELASASTDSTLMLWDVKENCAVRTFRGHTNEKNFVGLAVTNEFLACGSETNEVFVYHKAISKPATWHKFGSLDIDDGDDDAGSYFISAVCWKSENPTMLAANSRGTIKVMVLAS